MALASTGSMEEEQVATALAPQMSSTCSAASNSSSTLLALPDDLLTLCLLNLDSIRDLANTGATCKRLAQFALHSGPVWAPRCNTYVDKPSAWLAASLSVHGDMHSHQSCAGLIDRTPTSFRALYRLLVSLQPMVGFWRGVGDAPRGSLYHVSWSHDCVQVQQLQCDDSTKAVQLHPMLRLGPGYPLHTAELLGDTHLVVRQFRGQPRLPCAAAAAAAAVSAGGAFLPRKSRSRNELQVPDHSPGHTPPPGRTRSASTATATEQYSSPSGSSHSQEHEHLSHVPGGFGHEVLKYMASQVAPPRGAARRRAQREAARAALAASAAAIPSSGGVAGAGSQSTGIAAAAAVPREMGVEDVFGGDAANSSRAHAEASHAGASSSRASWQPGSGSHGAHHSNIAHSSSIQLDEKHSSAQTSRDALLLSVASPGGLTHLSSTDKHSQSNGTSAATSHITFEPRQTLSQSSLQGNSTSATAATAAAAAAAGNTALQLRSAYSQAHLEPVGPNVRTHHFVRMAVPQATRAHPLAGLWKGVYGPHGLEIVCVTYDFSASQARVLGWKATGDHNVPAGQDTWWASAAPQPQPWSDHELRLQEARMWLSDVPAAQPMWPGPAAPAAVQQPLGGDRAESAPALPKVQPHGLAAWPANHQALCEVVHTQTTLIQCQVVSSHIGCGRIAGHHYSNPQWVPGRLWVYDNGNIAFLYMWPGSEEEPMFMVDYTRVVV